MHTQATVYGSVCTWSQCAASSTVTAFMDHVKPSRSSPKLVNLPLLMQQQRFVHNHTFKAGAIGLALRAVMQADAARAKAQNCYRTA